MTAILNLGFSLASISWAVAPYVSIHNRAQSCKSSTSCKCGHIMCSSPKCWLTASSAIPALTQLCFLLLTSKGLIHSVEMFKFTHILAFDGHWGVLVFYNCWQCCNEPLSASGTCRQFPRAPVTLNNAGLNCTGLLLHRCYRTWLCMFSSLWFS